MADGSCPQVFVVDRPISCGPSLTKQKSLLRRIRKSLLLPLFGLVVFGFVLEGIFIYKLYKKTEVFSQFPSYFHPQNESLFQTPNVDGHVMEQKGALVSNEVLLHPDEIRERPMAHLQGSDIVGKNGVVQWVRNSDSFTNDMHYNSSGLVIIRKGYYYLYSKVHFQETKNCVMVTHRVIRNTTEYGLPIELMKSKSLYCQNEHTEQNNMDKEKDLWNSFLAGVFKLEAGDHIFVTLDKGLYPGPADNFFGAFMMS